MPPLVRVPRHVLHRRRAQQPPDPNGGNLTLRSERAKDPAKVRVEVRDDGVGIGACHARARTPEETDWPRIVALYEALGQLKPSPVVELNRAVAVAMASGPAAGLEIVDALVSEPSLKAYHLLPSVRGDFLFKLGRFTEAQAEFERAVSLTRNAREREFLLDRARACMEENSRVK